MENELTQAPRTEERKIDYRFKLLYAIGMFFIVAGHCGNGGVSVLYEIMPPYAFHLGLFAFASGYFFRDSNTEAPKRYVKKKLKTLILPMYLYNIAYALISTALRAAHIHMGQPISFYTLVIAPWVSGHQYIYNLGGWFLAPLFMTEMLALFVRRLLRKKNFRGKETVLFVCAIVFGIAGIYLAMWNGRTNPWLLAIERMAYMVPFYALGIYYRRVLEVKDTISNTWYFSIIFVAELLIVFICGKAPYYSPAWCNDFGDGPFLPFIIGFLGIAFWFRVCKLAEPIMGRNRVVNAIADNTYSIMMNQMIAFFIVKGFFACLRLSDFDYNAFCNEMWYMYLPKGLEQMKILYVIAGLAIPIGIQKCINAVKNRFQKKK